MSSQAKKLQLQIQKAEARAVKFKEQFEAISPRTKQKVGQFHVDHAGRVVYKPVDTTAITLETLELIVKQFKKLSRKMAS